MRFYVLYWESSSASQTLLWSYSTIAEKSTLQKTGEKYKKKKKTFPNLWSNQIKRNFGSEESQANK